MISRFLPLLVALLLVLIPSAHGGVEVSPPGIGLSINGIAGDIASNGDGFLAVFHRDYAEWSSGLVVLDREGRPIHEVARFASHWTAFVTRLDDHYLLSWVDAANRSRLSEVSATGEVLSDWQIDGVPSASYRAPYELHSTVHGDRILLADRTRSIAYLVTNDRVLLRTVPLSQTATIAGGVDRFFRIDLYTGSLAVNTIPADGTSAVVVQESRAERDEVPTDRVIAYLDHEAFPDIRRRVASR